MKGIKSIIVVAVVLITVVGIIIGVKGGDRLGEEDFVVVTNFPAYDFVRAVVGDKIDIKMLMKPGVEIHDFEPTPQDIIDIKNSKAFVYTGGESDEWIEDVLNNVEVDEKKLIKMMDIVQVVEEEIVEGMENDYWGENVGSDGYVESASASENAEYDEHIWTSIKNAIKIVNDIKNRFIMIFPEHKVIFEQNTEEYINRLSVLDQEFKKLIEESNRKTIVFGDRFPLRYFVDDYGLDYFAVFSGCSEQTEASSKTISFLVNKIKTEKIPVVFKIEMSDGKIANTIAKETGTEVLEFHSAHNVSVEDFESGVTYADIMERNLKVLEVALR